MILFFADRIENETAYLDEEESRHVITVLRHKDGDILHFTDGQGIQYSGILALAGKKQAILHITERRQGEDRPLLHIAIAPTKQIERFEWFLEKSTEIGIGAITPLLCARSERRQIRHDRLEKILHSAMKQSLRSWLPVLQPLTPLNVFLKNKIEEPRRCIAWCEESGARSSMQDCLLGGTPTLLLIGPEGDFTPEEVALARAQGFTELSLGAARLRTETAGVMAAAAFALLGD